MSNFWPEGISLSDTSSPLDILQSAEEEWREHSDGLLTLVLQNATSQKGNDMVIVHAKHLPSKRTVELFSVIYRPSSPYPARIQLRDELPDFLKKEYYDPGTAGVGISLMEAIKRPPRIVTNKWVCDTPAEFRSELSEVFNLGEIKTEILGLVSGPGVPSNIVEDSKIDVKEPQEEN